MRTSELTTGAAQLRDAFEELQTGWADVATQWNDQVSQKFCENHLQPLGPPVKSALEAINRMTLMVQQMHRECDEPNHQ